MQWRPLGLRLCLPSARFSQSCPPRKRGHNPALRQILEENVMAIRIPTINRRILRFAFLGYLLPTIVAVAFAQDAEH